MRIRTQFIITIVLFGLVLVAIITSVITTNQRVEKASRQEEIAGRIASGAGDLSYLADSFLIYGESQQLSRWQSRLDSFSNDVASLQTDDLQQLALVRNIQASEQRLKDVFNSVVSTMESSSQNQSGDTDLAFLRVSWSRIAVQSQELTFDASRLSQLLDAQVEQLQRTNMIIIFAMIGVFGAYFIASFLIIQQRMLKSIDKLRTGTSIIGAGNLDFQLDERRNDEIGDLSRAVNRMTVNLKAMTTTKADLETEVSERRKAEEELRETRDYLDNLFNYANAPIIVWNPKLEITRFNHAFERLTGRTSNEVLGKKLDILFPSGSRDASMSHIRDTMTGQRWEVVEIPIQHVSGTVRIVLWNSATLFDNDGKTPLAAIAQGQDITERVKVEQIKDEFIGLVSHELKTPITVIMGSVYTAMSKGISKKDAQVLLQDAASSAESLATIVDNLLELSRAQVDRLAIRKERVDIERVVFSIVAEERRKSGIHKLIVDLPPSIPTVLGDRVRIERILHNLLDNAIKYSPNGGYITVSVRKDDGCLVIGVKDQGVGVSVEDQTRLFQAFERLETAYGVSGVGLGLNVCRRLVEAQGGRIWVESETGKGSNFFFTLPLE